MSNFYRALRRAWRAARSEWKRARNQQRERSRRLQAIPADEF
jgi:hypothetical protein